MNYKVFLLGIFCATAMTNIFRIVF